MYMFNRIHLYNNYLIHVIYVVLCSAVEPMTTLSWQLCNQACYQVGYGYIYIYILILQHNKHCMLITLQWTTITFIRTLIVYDVIVEYHRGLCLVLSFNEFVWTKGKLISCSLHYMIYIRHMKQIRYCTMKGDGGGCGMIEGCWQI